MTDCTTDDTDCPNPGVNRRLDTTHADLTKINERLDRGSEKMHEIETTIARHHQVANEGRKRLEDKMDANTAAQNEQARSTAEILELVQALKGLRLFGKAFAWIVGVVAPLVAIWVALGGKK